jgi:hypothetical protein
MALGLAQVSATIIKHPARKKILYIYTPKLYVLSFFFKHSFHIRPQIQHCRYRKERGVYVK